MNEKFEYLIENGLIDQEDKKVLSLICTQMGEDDLSLLDLTTLKNKLERKLNQETSKTAIKFYVGLIELVENYTNEFINQQKTWRIM